MVAKFFFRVICVAACCSAWATSSAEERGVIDRTNSQDEAVSTTTSQAAYVDEECRSRKQSTAFIERLILEAATRYQVDPDLVWAKAQVESNLNPCIVSSAGAIGVMQLMPQTAIDLGVEDSFDAAANIDAGTKYLAALIEQFQIPQLYLAAYNAGPTAVMRKRFVPNYEQTICARCYANCARFRR